MIRRWFITAMALGFAACGGSSGGPSGPQITIRDFSFTPSALTVNAGTTVTWVNMGPSAHTTVSDSGAWTSAIMAAPDSGGGGYGGGMSVATFTFTFSTAGTYSYHCGLHPPASHPDFTGTITVTP